MPAQTRQRSNLPRNEPNIETQEEPKPKRIKKEKSEFKIKTETLKTEKQEVDIKPKLEQDDKADIEIKKELKTEIKEESDEKSEIKVEKFWLMKSEPETRMAANGQDMKFGIEDLKLMKDQTEHWDGVRNYQARNFMKAMKLGDFSFFYHSNCKVPGIAGVMQIVKEAYVDHTQFDSKDAHYDPKSTKENPKWIMVDIKFVRDFKRFIPLAELKELHLKHKQQGEKNGLGGLSLFTQSRLSIQSISKDEWQYIMKLENE